MLFEVKSVVALLLTLQASVVGAATTKASTTSKAKAATSTGKSTASYQNTVYFPNWVSYDRGYYPWNIPYTKVKTINYSFMDVRTTGEVIAADAFADVERKYPGDNLEESGDNAYGNVRQLYMLKQKNRNLKVLLGIGGWTHSGNFAEASSTADRRSKFAQTAVAFVRDYGLDGIDIDWEYPEDATQGANFLALLQAVRSALDSYSQQYANGYKFMLTSALSCVPWYYNVLKLKEMASVLDHFNLMGYDFSGPWTKGVAAHHANVYPSSKTPAGTPFSSHAALTAYIRAGVPASKIILGMPLYGHSFSNTDGIGQSFAGHTDGTTERDIYDYRQLPLDGATEIFDDSSAATYSYDSKTRQLISYDTISMIQRKSYYIKNKGLAGGMFWEASGDRNDTGSLIAAAAAILTPLDSSQNLLNYPTSKYKNIAANSP